MAQLGLQEAVARATEILKEELYPNQELKHVLLEEIERGSGGTWYVTLGFTRPGTMASIVNVGTPPPSSRAYKMIKLNAETGEFEGMTDRLLEESTR